MSNWNSEQYLKFQSERTQPAIDLAARLPLREPARILDVGCGPGNSTEALRRRYPQAAILGIDSSENMVANAAQNYPNLEFRLMDASGDLSALGKFDIVFSNACLQWIPDQTGLLKRLAVLLQPGGVLAVQVPMNEQEPIHQIISETIANEKWKDYFHHPRVFYTLPPTDYYQLLSAEFSQVFLWETTYYHILPSQESIMEWYRGTGLRPYLELLPKEQQQDFENDIFQRVIRAYRRQEDGNVLFPFPRLFFLAIL